MTDKTNIEILQEFARRSNREIFVDEKVVPITGYRRNTKFKRIVYMPYDQKRNCFYVWYNYWFASIGPTTFFSGVFFPVSQNLRSRLYIRKSNVLDKFNFISRSGRIKTGTPSFDAQTIISGKMREGAQRILSQHKVQKQILKSYEINNIVRLSIDEYKIDFIPELKSASHISIINQQEWEIDGAIIEQTFSCAEKMRSAIEI